MKKAILGAVLCLMIISIILMSCSKNTSLSVPAPANSASPEEKELSQGLDEVQQIDDVDTEMDDVDWAEVENIDLQ